MRLLVTGGAGFIGSTFVRRVLQGREPALVGAQVVVLDKLTYAGNQENLAPVETDPALHFIKGDITDGLLVSDLMAGVDAVVHFAAESHVDRSILGAGPFVMINVVGTQTLLQARAGGRRVAVRARLHQRGLRVDRVGFVVGEPPAGAEFALLDGLPVPLYGDGLSVRDWLHVDDHCRGISLVFERGRAGEIYNIGGGTELTNTELTGLLLAATGADWSSVRQVTDRKAHDRRYSVGWTKIRTQLGYRPSTDFTQGLADTVRWYAEHRDWWEPLKVTSATVPG